MFFELIAPFYDPAMRLMGADHRRAAELLNLREAALVLDLGGGTGLGAVAVARASGARALVVDRSRAMIRRAPRTPAIAPLLADAARLPLPNASVDGALILDALHHFSDPATALREVARVLRPGARLVIEDFDVGRPFVRALGRLEALFGEPGTFWTPPVLAAMLEGAGLRVAALQVEGATVFAVGEAA